MLAAAAEKRTAQAEFSAGGGGLEGEGAQPGVDGRWRWRDMGALHREGVLDRYGVVRGLVGFRLVQ